MGVISDAAVSRGDVMRRLDELDRQVQALRTARRMEASAIGAGGIRVRGGAIVIQDAAGVETMRLSTAGLTLEGLLQVLGQIQVAGEDGIVVSGGGSVVVQDGGAFEAVDGSRLRARYDDGTSAVVWGSLTSTATGASSGHGLLVQDDDAGGGADIFRAVRRPDGLKGVYAGEGGANADEFIIGADVISLFRTADSGLNFTATNGFVVSITATTSSSANLHLSGASGSGIVSRSTSSQRYKQDIADYRPPPTVLDLRPRSWRDRGEVERDPDTTNRYMGLIAEEVDALGLTELVTYSEAGEPDAVAYDRLAVALLDVVRDQRDQLAALTEWATAQGYVAPQAARTAPESGPPIKAVPGPQPTLRQPGQSEPRSDTSPVHTDSSSAPGRGRAAPTRRSGR